MARENIDVTVELHDALSRPAHRTEEAIQDLREETNRLNNSLRAMDLAQHRAASANRSLDRALGRTTRSTAGHTRSVKEAQREQRGHNRLLGAGKAALGGLIGGLIGASKKARVLGLAMKAAKFGLMATGATLAATAVSALGAAAVAAVAGLAPLIGTLGAIPALLLSLGAAGAAIKVGFSGIGDAVKVLSDPTSTAEELNEALSKLSPAAREFVTTFAEFKEQAKGIKDAVQAAMLPGFTAALKSLAPLIDVVGDGLAVVGKVVGDLAQRGGAMIGTWGGDLRTIFASAAKVTASLGGALLMVVSIFKNFALAGGPLAERFAAALERGALYLNHMVEQGTRTGKLTAFFERAGDFASAFWTVLSDLSVALFNVGKLSGELGSALGGGFAGMIKDFREFTESLAGQQSIRQWFADATPIVMEVGRLVKDLAVGLGGLAGNTDLLPLLQQLRTEVLPAVLTLIEKMSIGLGPGLLDTVTGVATALGALPFSSLVEMSTALGNMAMALGGALEDSPALATTVSGLLAAKLGVDVLGGGFDKAKQAVEGFQSGVEKGRDAVGALKDGVGAARDAAKAAGRMGQNMSRAFSGQLQRSQMGPFHRMLNRVGNAIRSNTVLNAIWTKTVKVATAAMRIMGRVAKFMFGPWGIAIMLVIGALVLLYKKNERFRELVQRVARAVVEFGKTAWDWIKRVGMAVGKWLLGVWQRVVPVVVGVAKAIWGAMQSVWGVVKTVFGAIWGVVKAVLGFVVGYFRVVFKVYKTIFEVIAGIALWLFREVIAPAAAWVAGQLGAAWGWIRDKAVAAFTWVAGKATWLWDKISAGMAWLRDRLGAAWDWIKEKASAIWAPIGAAAAWLWEKVSDGAGWVRDKVVGAFEWVREKAGGVWSWISEKAKAAFDGLMGVVQPIIDRVQRAFQGLRDTVGGVWDSIRSGFGSAMDSIRGAINTVIRTINKLIDGLNRVKVGEDIPNIPELGGSGQGTPRTVAQAAASRNTGRFAGGPVMPGVGYTVAELGPELFVPRIGPISVLGGDGGAMPARFPTAGYVVPNPGTPDSLTNPIPSWVTDRLEPGHSNAGGGGTAVMTEAVPDVHLHFHGEQDGITPADVEAAALRAWRRFDRERRERR